MKVLVHLNHGQDRSMLLDLKENNASKKIRGILCSADHDLVIQRLLMAAVHVHEIPPHDKKKAESLADFTVSQHGYTIERLA